MNRFFFLILLTFFQMGINSQALNQPVLSSSSFLHPLEKQFLPANAMDGRLDSSWVEGAKGDGIGESLTISYKSEIKIHSFTIYNGFGDPKQWGLKNRIKKLKMKTNKGYEEIFDLKDSLHSQTFKLKSQNSAISVTLTILEIYQGSKSDDTAIAELNLMAIESGSGLAAPKNTWAVGKWKTESNIAKINLFNDGTCEMGYESAKMLCTWIDKGDRVVVNLEATLPLTNTDILELKYSKQGNKPVVEINGKFIFFQNIDKV